MSHRVTGFSHISRSSPVFYKNTPSDLHPQIVKQARKSGRLNLTNRGYNKVPDQVWTINSLSDGEVKSLSVSMDSTDEKWWDQVDLTYLNLSSNVITEIPSDIQNLCALENLDLHDNKICDLPETIESLNLLKKLDLSHNELSSLPSALFELKDLRYLNLQNNELTTLDDGIGNLSKLEDLNISSNKLQSIPFTIGYLLHVTVLNLSQNQLSSVPPEIGSMSALRTLDLSNNLLKSIPESIGELEHLQILYLRHNCLKSVPVFPLCNSIKELYCGNNRIEELTTEHLEPLISLKILELRDNRIQIIPDNISVLALLERLDLTNNNISVLPNSLSLLIHLNSLSLDGNPLRSIRRDIIQRGTQHLLRFLRSRLEEENPDIQFPTIGGSRRPLSSNGSKISHAVANMDKFTLKATKTLDFSDVKSIHECFHGFKCTRCSIKLGTDLGWASLSSLTPPPEYRSPSRKTIHLALCNKEASAIPDIVFEIATECEVNTINLSKNILTEVPAGLIAVLPRAVELDISFNRLTSVPSEIGKAVHLTYLDVRYNQLNDLPDELTSLSHLRELAISYNKFKSIPSAVYELPKLEILFAENNQIEEINVTGLSRLTMLTVLDLRNNDITKVPPELGNMKQLRSLQLEGNAFRQPRPDILSKGTDALLRYLRDRIPT